MRLIDAWKLCEYANNLKDKQVDANDIMRFPTVDAEPVRHGHWIRPYNDHYRQCSVCGRVHYSIPWNAEYCPFCGAKMDGGAL